MLEIPLVLIFNYSTKNRTSGIRTSGDRTSGGPPVYAILPLMGSLRIGK